jgi:hypothetical protein
MGSSSSDNQDSAEMMRDTTATMRRQQVFVRRISEGGAMAWVERCKAKAHHVCRRICCLAPSAANAAIGVDVENPVGNDRQQYRLETSSRNSSWMHSLSCGFLGRSKRRRGHMTMGINPNQQLAMYLHWMFRVNFLFLFLLMCIMFFVLVMAFAALIIIAGSVDANCVRIGGQPFGQNGSAVADGFALSWTTFSTVVSNREKQN